MKYNIFVYGFMVISAISIMSCSGKKKNFSPSEPGRADITKSSVITDSVEGENAVKLTIMVQKPSSDFPQNAAQALESKMLTIASKNGIVGYGGDPAFVFAALITPLGKDVTTTPPVKKVMKYTLNLYVANVVTGDVYGSSSMDLMGIGNSFELAALNAITSVDDNSNIQKMLHEASNKIISWYQNHSKEFISKVSDYITHEEFDKAYALLASVPSEASECFQFAQENKAKVYEKYLRKLSSDNYRKMLSEIASSQNQYNPVVGGYFQMIPQSSPEYTKAKQMYEDYISKTAKQAELEKDREYYLEKEKLEVQKLEIQAQMAATEAMQAENESKTTIDTGNNVVNMIIDQAVQIGVPHLIGLLL